MTFNFRLAALAPHPDDVPDFSFGIASDCVEVTKPLAAGDKKGARLEAVLPFCASSGSAHAAERVLDGVGGAGAGRWSMRRTR